MRKLFTLLCLCLIGGWVCAADLSQLTPQPGHAQAQSVQSAQSPCHEHTAPALASHTSPCKSDVHSCCQAAIFTPTPIAPGAATATSSLVPVALALELGLRRERVYKPPRFTLPA